MGRGWITDEADNVLIGGMEAVFSSELLNRREGGALVRGQPRQDFGGQGQWPVEKNVLDGGVARRLCALLSFPVGVQITRSVIAKV